MVQPPASSNSNPDPRDPSRSEPSDGDPRAGESTREGARHDEENASLPESTASSIDGWVAAWLDSEAAAVNATDLADRILARHAATRAEGESEQRASRRVRSDAVVSPATRRSRWRRWGGALALLSSAVAVALLVSPRASWLESPVNADAIVSAAHAAHDLPIERVYEVTIEREMFEVDSDPPRSFVQSVRVATQGDRFWVEMNRGARSWVWGREPDGAIWIVLGPHAAVRLEADEVGAPLRRMSDVYSLSIGTLLEDLPRGFSLTEVPAQDPDWYAVQAQSRRSRAAAGVKTVTAQIDRSSHEVRQLVLERRLAEHLTTTTYRLVESKPADIALYSVEGHMDDRNLVLDSRVPLERRRELLVRRLGPFAGRWLQHAPE